MQLILIDKQEVGISAALGADLGFVTGPGGMKLGKVLTSRLGLSGTSATANEVLRELVAGLPFAAGETGFGIFRHYSGELFEDLNLRERFALLDFSNLSITERFVLFLQLEAMLKRMLGIQPRNFCGR